MTDFAGFNAAAPVIASFVAQRITATGLTFVATTRSDGWPRVSPMEISLRGGRLYVGSMPNAVKAQDLRRDSRCCVITTLADREDLAGEAKLFCRAREITGGAEWEEVRAVWRDAIDLDIGEPGGSHMFELEIEAAAWQRVEDDTWRTTSWASGGEVRERVRVGPIGESQDL